MSELSGFEFCRGFKIGGSVSGTRRVFNALCHRSRFLAHIMFTCAEMISPKPRVPTSQEEWGAVFACTVNEDPPIDSRRSLPSEPGESVGKIANNPTCGIESSKVPIQQCGMHSLVSVELIEHIVRDMPICQIWFAYR